MKELRLSASAIADWRACPRRYQLAWLYGLEPEKEKDFLRIGEVWHRVHEIINMKPGDICPDCKRQQEIWPQCPLCNGTGKLPENLMDSIIRYLDKRYEQIPEGKIYDAWRVEQLTILHSLIAYRWHYGQENPFETIASEIWFELPIINPDGKKTKKAKFVGKIDQLVRDKQTELIYIFERKSTSQSLDNIIYWKRLEKDTQITSYLWAARVCQLTGKLEKIGIKSNDPLVHGVFYDVWHKPDIKPRKLTKAEIKIFVEDGDYYGEKFEFGQPLPPDFETPEMYASRLLADICERSEHYFARREIPRYEEQLINFEKKLPGIVKHIRFVDVNNLWDENDRACEVPFYCDFRDICYNQTDIGQDECPQGYRRKNERKN